MMYNSTIIIWVGVYLEKNRVYSLDKMKGIISILIALYHYVSWSESETLTFIDQFLSKIGIYGVSIFYVISGTTLFLVYENRLKWPKIGFIFKRLIRISPLFYLATIITIFLNKLNGFGVPDLYKIIINFTYLFGIVDHGNYIVTGGWFIGNIVFFYLIFPFLLKLIKKSVNLFKVLFALAIGIAIYVSSFLSNGISSWDEYWVEYINPLNQLYLFVGGMLIGWLYKNKKLIINQKKSILIFISFIILFSLAPMDINNQIYLVMGIERILFSIITFSICYFALMIKTGNSSLFSKSILFFGEVSFSIYLYHPIAYQITKMVSLFNGKYDFIIFVCLTLSLSVITHMFVDIPVKKYCQKIIMS